VTTHEVDDEKISEEEVEFQVGREGQLGGIDSIISRNKEKEEIVSINFFKAQKRQEIVDESKSSNRFKKASSRPMRHRLTHCALKAGAIKVI